MRCASSRRKEGEGEAHHGDLGLVHWLRGAGPPKAGVNASPAEGAPGTHEERRLPASPLAAVVSSGAGKGDGVSVEGRADGFVEDEGPFGIVLGASQAVTERASERGRKEGSKAVLS